MTDQPRRKVVILGGGMAALTTAFELTNREGWQETFSEISVYQVGWRLGGKAAGGRNRQVGARVEGIGPHVWFGFYDNAFRLVQDCYAELNRPAGDPFADWRDVFRPQQTITLYAEENGDSRPWTLQPPVKPGLPGEAEVPRSPWQLLASCMQLVHEWWTKLSTEPSAELPEEKGELRESADQWVKQAVEYTGRLQEAIHTAGRIKPLMTTALDILDESHRWVKNYVESLTALNERERRLWIQQDLALTCMRGALRDWVPLEGFGALDDRDFREWLKGHGASPVTMSSPLLAGLYGFLFAFTAGDRARQNVAAGVALRLLCRATLDSRGAAVWTSSLSTGDAVFAPLYEVLRERGVKFHFFHRVKDLRLDDNATGVEEILLERQATPVDEYDPLIDVKGLPCWPHVPRYELLEEGDELQKRQIDLESPWSDWEPVEHRQLRAGEDFDDVILGISLGALPYCCSDLIRESVEWKQMLEETRTVTTAVSQLWFNRTLSELGWAQDPPSMLTAFRPPLETWIDFTESSEWEEWDGTDTPRCTATLRGALREREDAPPPGASKYPEEQQQRVREAALAWLVDQSARLWPELLESDRSVHWEYLIDPRDRQGTERLDAQYHGAMINPGDRYVQSVAGSTRFRLPADRPWFGNLFICGDWTRTELNVGCLEAAVMSGRQAAAAVRGESPPADLGRDW